MGSELHDADVTRQELTVNRKKKPQTHFPQDSRSVAFQAPGQAAQYGRRDSHPNSASLLHRKSPHVSAKLCKDLTHKGHAGHKVSSSSPATAGSDWRSCLYHWGSTSTDGSKSVCDELAHSTPCTLLDVPLHSGF